MSLAIAGLMDSALAPPHRLQTALPGPRPPVPIGSLLRQVVDAGDSALVTLQLHRFLGPSERGDWRKAITSVSHWTALGCERPSDHPVVRLGARVAWICYARGDGPSSGTAVTAYYTEDWHAADISGYAF